MTQDHLIDCVIEYDVLYEQVPLRVEECHGYHYFDDSTIECNLTKVYIDIAGVQIDITDRLTKEERAKIENSIEPKIDI